MCCIFLGINQKSNNKYNWLLLVVGQQYILNALNEMLGTIYFIKNLKYSLTQIITHERSYNLYFNNIDTSCTVK